MIMRKKISLCIFTLVGVYMFPLSLLAQSYAEEKKSKVQVSFTPFLSTNGLHSCDYSNNVSFNILVGVSKNEEFFTFAGLANIVRNEAKGLQFAGLANYVGNKGNGMQFAGITNISKNHYNGFQFAGLANIAGNIKGFQLGGIINIAKDVNGVQLAGLVNIAENSDYPIGIVNIIKNGEKSISLTYNDLGSTMISFRSGGKVTYGIVGIGYNHKTSGRSYVTEAGLGAHINCLSWFRINNELKAACFGYSNNPFTIDNDDHLKNTVFNISFCIQPGIRISPHLELFAGPSISYINAGDAENKLIPKHPIWKRLGSSRDQYIHIGYQVGIQYIF